MLRSVISLNGNESSKSGTSKFMKYKWIYAIVMIVAGVTLISTAQYMGAIFGLAFALGAILFVGGVFMPFKRNKNDPPIKETNDMYSVMGVGKTLYGKREVATDGSYIATKWFIYIFLPIFPLGSYRVWRGETTNTTIPFVTVGASTQYRMVKVPLNRSQVIWTYLVAYGVPIVAILLALEYILPT